MYILSQEEGEQTLFACIVVFLLRPYAFYVSESVCCDGVRTNFVIESHYFETGMNYS